jgi:hypothetical protein
MYFILQWLAISKTAEEKSDVKTEEESNLISALTNLFTGSLLALLHTHQQGQLEEIEVWQIQSKKEERKKPII